MILCVVIFLSILLKIEQCFVYDYLLTAGCVNIHVNCTVVVVETEYSKKRIEKDRSRRQRVGAIRSDWTKGVKSEMSCLTCLIQNTFTE